MCEFIMTLSFRLSKKKEYGVSIIMKSNKSNNMLVYNTFMCNGKTFKNGLE